MTLRATGALVVIIALSAALAAPASGMSERSAASAKRRCHGHVATLVGSTKSERLVGTPARDAILGLDGSDRIIGRGGDDTLRGGRDRVCTVAVRSTRRTCRAKRTFTM